MALVVAVVVVVASSEVLYVVDTRLASGPASLRMKAIRTGVIHHALVAALQRNVGRDDEL